MRQATLSRSLWPTATASAVRPVYKQTDKRGGNVLIECFWLYPITDVDVLHSGNDSLEDCYVAGHGRDVQRCAAELECNDVSSEMLSCQIRYYIVEY